MNAQEILVEIHKLPLESQKQVLDSLARSIAQQPTAQPPITEEEFLQRLLAKGLISEIPLGQDDEDEFEPVEVMGEPVSETIIGTTGI